VSEHAKQPDQETAADATTRRELLKRMGAAPLAAGVVLSAGRVQAAQQHVHKQAARASGKHSIATVCSSKS